ncbi:PARP-domain-containing protein [Fomitiporia mediterranea MF3/22]|uniref:PARP-domain-containing protein n=1 Tax=Fomitiporia mediterranea (strain MF3/22) TaxID=694068 RepID=UPI00044081F2|nr:PARP-domain-containing protein [Fomitiporia mediterranea MF3/22]EJD04410.1 PARP-domain-containing protein [Fomitiporia mediterranea MF3/22]
MVTVLKRGSVPVDPASSFINTHQVYVSPEGEIWDAMLNQTNIGKNANKFYVLQLLHPIGDASQCILFLRWGRTGESGASQTKGPWATSIAINEFRKQFRSKTSTPWEQRAGMTAKPGKYIWLERDYDDSDSKDKEEENSGAKGKGTEKPVSARVPDSTLPEEVQSLCRVIFNVGYINAALSAMNYDANKLPLGKLSKATILKGFSALKALSDVIENSANTSQYGGFDAACAELSNQYYSIIPHVFGRQKPIIINTMQQLKKELELVDALGDMEIAQKLINEKADANWDGEPVNPIDVRFRSLQLESMIPVASDSKEFGTVAAYAYDTHGSTHSYYKVSVQNVFRVKRKFEDENWAKAGFESLGDGQRLLLWHGSRSTNFAGILSQGLRIAPPEAPVNGYMFGKGVYFADMMSKSYNYCYPGASGNIGILLLCDVAAKPCHELLNASYIADQECKNAGKLTTRGIGRTQPIEWQDAGEALDNDELKGCLMPKGPAKEVNPPGAYLQYNEYIVYNTAQIRVKYLLMVKMQH